MKNKSWLISIAVSILLIISTIFTIGETRKLKTEISDLELEIIELQSVDKESFKITQEEIDALYQLIHTQEEEITALNEVILIQQDEIVTLQKQVKTTSTQTTTTKASTTSHNESTTALYSADTFKNRGVINWNGWKWTWYTERILPGEGLNIPGRYTDSEGWVRDGDGYLCLASSTLSKGTIISTPFGSDGKVYDCGCAVGTVDVYTNW